MIQFDLPQNTNSSMIKVIGVGGGGSNAVNYMYGLGIDGVDFIVCNTDQKALNNSHVPTKIQLGPSLTQGLGAGANPEIGQKACVESMSEIENLLVQNTKMVFITAGMGGGTGTGGAPVLAKVARDLGILTVGIVTTPFSYEGKRRQRQADEGIEAMREYVDTLLVISNDKLRLLFGNIPTSQAFNKADDILATATKCITDVINSQGHIVVDFADVSTVMRDGGRAILGSAMKKGENRAYEAVEEAINSPLLNDSNIRGAKWILLNINSSHGAFEHTLDEVEMIQAYVQDQAGEECDVIFGTGFDDNLGEHISVTVIATGFEYNQTEKAYSKEHKTPYSDRNKIVMKLDESGQKNSFFENEIQPVADMIPPMEEATLQPIPEIVSGDPLMPTLTIIEEPVIPSMLALGLSRNRSTMKEELKESTPSATEEKVTFELSVEPTPAPIVETPMEDLTVTPLSVQDELDSMFNPSVIMMVEKTPEQMEDEYVTIKGITLKRRKGSRLLSDAELEAEANFELQKRAFDERASKLRSMSFNIHSADVEGEQDENNVPAYQRKNVNLEDHPHSSEITYSNIVVKNNQPDSPLGTINSFLHGNQPD